MEWIVVEQHLISGLWVTTAETHKSSKTDAEEMADWLENVFGGKYVRYIVKPLFRGKVKIRERSRTFC